MVLEMAQLVWLNASTANRKVELPKLLYAFHIIPRILTSL
jgi:hypothetical protein